MIISRLFIYPIKSCAPVEVDQLGFDDFGPRGDRRFMLVDEQGKFLSQRQLPVMARIQPALRWRENGELAGLLISAPGQDDFELVLSTDLSSREVTVWKDTLLARDCGDPVADWFSAFLQRRCRLVQLPANSQRQVSLKRAPLGRYHAFADGYPLLVVTQASLDHLSQQVGRDVAVERFRPNVVVTGAEQPFAELSWKRLGLERGYLDLVKPCVRCVVPTRGMDTLEREADVLEALKQSFRVDGQIVFGQNAIDYDVTELAVGDSLMAQLAP